MSIRSAGFRRNPTTQSASWILDLYDAGKLDLDPPYQRKSVWNTPYKQFFIDSVVRNFPTQAIFLDLTVDPDRPSEYRVLDGKQRLTTLIEFVNDKFIAPQTLADLGLEDKYYSEMERAAKLSVLNYLFTVEIVSDTSNTELNDAFDRLNRNVKQLNKQELRHAQYNGSFITKMEQLAGAKEWRSIGIATDSRVRRMQDVEYISEFYVATLLGIQDGKDYLDKVYADFDEEITGEERADGIYLKTLEYISDLDEEMGLKSTRFSNVADFYSLWAATSGCISENIVLRNPHQSAQMLTSFAKEVSDESTPVAKKYLSAAIQGSNKKPNRQLRADTIIPLISTGV